MATDNQKEKQSSSSDVVHSQYDWKALRALGDSLHADLQPGEEFSHTKTVGAVAPRFVVIPFFKVKTFSVSRASRTKCLSELFT